MGQVTLVSDGSPEAERIARDYEIRAGTHPTHHVVEVPGLDDLEAGARVRNFVGDFPYGRAPVIARYPALPPCW